MPVDADAVRGRAELVNHRPDKSHDRFCAVRRRVADRIGNAQALCACTNRGGKERPQRVGIGARRVLGHIHDLEALFHRKRDRLLRALLQVIDRPAFGILPDRAGSDESAALDRHTGALHDIGNRLDIGDHGAGCAVGANRQLAFADRTRQAFNVASDVGTGSRQPDVGRVESETVHLLQNLDLFVDRRRADRRRLQAVPQRLVVEHRQRSRAGGVVVPVVYQRVRCDAHGVTCWMRTRRRREPEEVRLSG